VAHHPLRDAADQEPRNAGPSRGRHDDRVGTAGCIDDALERPADMHPALEGEATTSHHPPDHCLEPATSRFPTNISHIQAETRVRRCGSQLSKLTTCCGCNMRSGACLLLRSQCSKASQSGAWPSLSKHVRRRYVTSGW